MKTDRDATNTNAPLHSGAGSDANACAFQTALARLLSNRDLRRRFREDPDRTAAEWGIARHDLRALTAIAPDELERQADGLISKRFHEVRGLLPWTCSELGGGARKHFIRFAATRWPTGHKRHVEDAVGFCRYLSGINAGKINRFEWGWLEFVLSDRRFRVRGFTDWIRNGKPRSGIVVMLRKRGRPRYSLVHWPRPFTFRTPGR